MPDSAAQRIIASQFDVLSFSGRVTNLLWDALKAARDDLLQTLESGQATTPFSATRQQIFLAQVDAALLRANEQYGRELEPALRATVIHEYEATTKALLAEAGEKLPDPFPVLPLERVQQLASKPIGGKTLQPWLNKHFKGLRNELRREVAQSVLLGEDLRTAGKRLKHAFGLTRHGAETLAHTALLSTAHEARQAVYKENASLIKSYKYLATLDRRTCLVAGTQVLTPTGEVPIESIKAGDLVIGGSGRPRRVLATRSQNKTGEFVKINIGNRTLCGTSDHLILSADGWVEMGSIGLETRIVVSNEIFNKDKRFPGIHIPFRYPDYLYAVSRNYFLVPGGILGGVLVPEYAVNFDGDPILRQIKIDGPSAEFLFLDKSKIGPFEKLPGDPFGFRLPGEFSVAGNATELSVLAWAMSKIFPAFSTRCANDWTPAKLGTIFSFPDFARLYSEFFSAIRTLSFSALSTFDSFGTVLPAHLKSMGIAPVDLKGFSAKLAGLFHFRFIEQEAFSGAISSWPGFVIFKNDPASLTGRFRSALLTPGDSSASGGAESRLWPGANKFFATRTAIGIETHAKSLRNPEAIFNEKNSTKVYDIQVDKDECFFAEGVLVHNCPLCQPWDGQEAPTIGGLANVPQHPRCRCVIIPVTSLARAGTRPAVLETKSRVVHHRDGTTSTIHVPTKVAQVSSTTTYEQFFKRQPAEWQRSVLGPARYKMWKEGRVQPEDFTRGPKDAREIIPLDELRAKLRREGK